MTKALFVSSLLFLSGCSSLATAKPAEDLSLPCVQDEPRRKDRSDELQKIVREDQQARKDWVSFTPDQIKAMGREDVVRRKRVGEIFGEGCFSLPQDYAAASLVFQHGDSPDHFYQVFLWSKRGVELGDSKQKDLMALGIDRYLVNVGKKQLFATQAFAEKADGCFCLQQVEPSFPDKRRREYTRLIRKERLKWVDQINAKKACAPASECTTPLLAMPKGSLPGFW